MTINDVKKKIADALTNFNKNRYGEEVRSFLTEAITLLKDIFPLSSDAIADKAVSADKLQAGSVTQPKIQDGAVTEGKIRDGAVTTAKIAEKAVTLNKINPAETKNKVLVTVYENDKLETHWREVDSSMIMDGQIQNSDIKDNSIVGSEKLKPKSVTGGRIADGTVGTQQISDKAVNADKLQAGSVTQPKIKDGAVTEGKIADKAVSRNKLSDELWEQLSGLFGSGGSGIFDFKGNLKKEDFVSEGMDVGRNGIWALNSNTPVVISSETGDPNPILYENVLEDGAIYRFAEDGDIPLSVRYNAAPEFTWRNVKRGDLYRYNGYSVFGDPDFVEALSLGDEDANFKWEYLGNYATLEDLESAVISSQKAVALKNRTFLLRNKPSSIEWEEVHYGGSVNDFSKGSYIQGAILRFIEDGSFDHLDAGGMYTTDTVSAGDEWRYNGLTSYGEDWQYLGMAAPDRTIEHEFTTKIITEYCKDAKNGLLNFYILALKVPLSFNPLFSSITSCTISDASGSFASIGEGGNIILGISLMGVAGLSASAIDYQYLMLAVYGEEDLSFAISDDATVTVNIVSRCYLMDTKKGRIYQPSGILDNNWNA